jgi:predicted metallo-beta-lactamase superfamily hydrolase
MRVDMLKKIHVVPLAAESLGTRSMCTSVETPDIRVLLDAGVSLCPNRFGLPPHPTEFRKIGDARRLIAQASRKAEIVTLSHYHYDHHTPSFEDWLVNWTEPDETAREIYQDKVILVKNPRENINFSQRERGWMFGRTGGKYAKEIINADGKQFTFGRTSLRFSEPVFHGSENSELGWVLMVTVEVEEERFMFAPDVQGPMSSRPLQIIEKEKPQLLMIGGPPLYLSTTKVSENQLQTGLKNLNEIVQKIPHVILDHHVIRDENWQEKTMNVIYDTYRSNSTLQTAAEFVGKKNTPLEAQRKRLFTESPPTREFEKWMKTSEETKRHSKPPI